MAHCRPSEQERDEAYRHGYITADERKQLHSGHVFAVREEEYREGQVNLFLSQEPLRKVHGIGTASPNLGRGGHLHVERCGGASPALGTAGEAVDRRCRRRSLRGMENSCDLPQLGQGLRRSGSRFRERRRQRPPPSRRAGGASARDTEARRSPVRPVRPPPQGVELARIWTGWISSSRIVWRVGEVWPRLGRDDPSTFAGVYSRGCRIASPSAWQTRFAPRVRPVCGLSAARTSWRCARRR